MARFKDYSYDQTALVAISYDKQIQPGTFEYALNTIVDEMDLTVFEDRYHNDDTGAPAYDPGILLKIILFAYSRGILTSREIALACVENVTFMALAANSRPHFTTIADFVSSLKLEISQLFAAVLTVCSSEGLIGKGMFAVDGCKISSNCSKEWSGTRADFEKKKKKLEKSIRRIVEKHRKSDELELDEQMVKKEKAAVRRLREKVSKIRTWLNENDDKRGPSGSVKQSNLTDNGSAKMPSSHGVIQGHNGQAMVDAKHQVVVAAAAFGEGQDHGLLAPMIEETRQTFESIGEEMDVFEETTLVADAGYHSEKNMEKVIEEQIDAYVADGRFRKRDPDFADAERYKRPIDRKKTPHRKARYFQPNDFVLDKKTGKLICPAGNRLYVAGSNYKSTTGARGTRYKGWKTKCRTCELRPKCMRATKTESRSVVLFRERTGVKGSYTRRMIEKLDSAKGRYMYGRRLGIVEPVFAHIRHAIGLDRFTLRGTNKVDTQWKLFCMVHNLKKLWRYAPQFAC